MKLVPKLGDAGEGQRVQSDKAMENVEVRAGAQAAILEHEEESAIEEFLVAKIDEPLFLMTMNNDASPGPHLHLGFVRESSFCLVVSSCGLWFAVAHD